MLWDESLSEKETPKCKNRMEFQKHHPFHCVTYALSLNKLLDTITV